MKISVCMATYNGEKYIRKQLESILNQLRENDELIISDDSSDDRTLDIIRSFNDSRIKLLANQKFKSPIFNFENSIKHANGDIIVLSDQDDIWNNNKIEVVIQSFENSTSKPLLKMFNGKCIDQDDNVIYNNLFDQINAKEGLLNIIIKNSFIGCNIAFNKSLLKYVLPFPKDIPMHDSWLATNAYLYGKVGLVDQKIFNYRLHSNNYTSKRSSLYNKIAWRINLIKNLIIRYHNVKL